MSAVFSPQRISKTSVIALNAALEKVFPLFGPIKEKEWAAGWDPEMIHPTSGEVEEHMVFKTTAHPSHEEPDYIWTLSKYLPEEASLEYTVFTPERIWWITIRCWEEIPDQMTKAEITYTYQGLTERGNKINERALQRMYAHNLKDWEEAINYYLETGKRLETSHD